MSDDTKHPPTTQATGKLGKRYLALLAVGLAFALTNAIALARLLTGEWRAVQSLLRGSVEPLATALGVALQSAPEVVAYLGIAPFVLALLAGMCGSGVRTVMTEKASDAGDVVAEPPGQEALALLRLLQEEGRLVDFIGENIDAYDDAQVGAAARSIHAACRKALERCVVLRRIYEAAEGTTVTVDPGFDPAEVRLTGNVRGEPPFSGILQHAGWQVVEVKLPARDSQVDPSILAPAEVEIR